MATPIRDAMINNSSKDGTGDAIEGSEVDANPNTIADLLDGTSTTVWGQAGQVSFETLGIKEDAVAAGAVKDKWVYEWDPSDGSNLTDNSSGLGMVWKMPDDADNQTEFANLDIMCNDDAASSEDAEFVFSTVINATMREVFSVGSQGTVFNEDSRDLDFRIETDNIANGFIVDAGLDVFSFGAAAADDKFVTISPPAASHTATTDTYALHVTAGGAQTIPSGTTALVASLAVEEPNITATGTVTNAATVYIKNAPTEGGTGNYALWIDAGASQLDGTLTVGGIIKTDDTTEATSTTDGSLQTDGGLSVAKDAIFGDDVRLLSDSAILSLGAGNDATLTHDGTTGVVIAANPITITSGGAATWSTSSGALTVTSAAALNLNPASGSAIVLDGTINVDAGVVTGATSITLSGELDAGSLDISGAADIAGDLTLSAGADGALTFANAGENSIKIPDNQASALIIEEANAAYLTFVTTNSGEKITLGKKLEAGSVEIEGSAFDINGGAIDGTIIGAASAAAGSFAALVGTSLDINGAADISGDLTLSAGADGALTFANAGENSIKIPDNQASALIIEEADAAYLTFVTTNSGEKITLGKKLEAGSVEIEGSGFDINGGAIDGTIIGAASAAAGTFAAIVGTSLNVSDGNITNVGDIALDSISSDAGTSINVVLGSDAGDDFKVDTDKLVVEGDTGRIGIGTACPDNVLHIKSTSPATIRLETTADADSDIIFQTGSSGMARVGIDFQDAKSLKMNVSGSMADDHLCVGAAGSDDCNVGIGTASWGTNAVNVLAIYNGTAPSSSPANTVQLYANDDSSSPNLSVLRLRDEEGNDTVISPHDFGGHAPSEPLAWAYHSTSAKEKKSITVDMLRVVRVLEQLSGEQLVYIEEAI